MNKKLVRHGNSLALVIDKPLLKLLGIDENSTLEIEVQGEVLMLKASKKRVKNKSTKEQGIREIGKKIIKKYEPVFKKLAKT